MGISIKIGGGAASIPSASTSTAGKVRLATNVETTTGTATNIAVTPAGLSAALSGIVGGMTYKGFWDAINAVPDLSNAKQGDFYYISAAGTRYGKEWAVGDHLVVNANMGGTIDGNKLDKIDSTESISTLGSLTDVTLTDPSDGQGLTYDSATSQWINSDIVSDLNDLGDVTLTDPSDGQGLVYNASSSLWVNSAIVEGIDDLSDVALNALTSTSYSNSTTSAALVNLRDHITEITAEQTAIRTIPTSLSTDNLLLVSNIGAGEVELRVSGSAVFWVAGAPSTTPITITATTRATLTGLLREGVVTWSVSQAAISPRQSLTRIGSADWTNGYINAYDVQGVASQGEINNLQAELNATQTGAGLGSDGTYTERTGSNYLNSSTSLYSADTLLDSALKSEATTRASADSTLQANINSEASTRASADSTLQSNINSEASTRASADSTLQTNINTEASTRASADTSLQNELNTTQTGAGLSATGAYTARSGSNYLDSSTSLYSADTLLDGALKAVSDQVDLLGTQIVSSVNGIAPVEGDVTLTATDISGFATVATSGAYADLSGTPSLATVATSGSADDVSVAHTAINYTAASADVEAHLAGIDAQLGVGLVNSVNDVLPVGGNVTLTAADLNLSTVATSGAYADLSGTPSLATVATSGEAADVNVVASPSNYTAASPDVEAHLAGIDTVLGTLGGDIVSSVNGIAPVVGDVTVTAQDIDTNHTAVNYTATGASVTEHVAGIDSVLGDLLTDSADALGNRIYSNAFFVNDGVSDVQAGIDEVTSANKLVWVSPGSYGGSTVLMTDKDLIKVRAEGCGTGAFGIVELVSRGLTISGATSTRNLVQGFQVEGLTTINGTLGRHALIDCQLLGGLTITNGTANFITIRDCDITGTLTIGADVTATIYLVQCNLTGLTIANSAGAARLIIANCSGVPLSALTAATVAGQSGFADGSFRAVLSTATLPNALSFTGRTSELTNNANFITAAQAPVQSVNTLTGAVTLNGANLTSANTPVNYTAATSALNSHLSGIDTVLGTLGGSTVVSVNGVAPVAGDVTVTGQVIDTNHTEINYTSAGASVTEHIAGIDTAVGLRPLTTATLLKAGNLGGLADVATARTNLGLGSAATKTAGSAIGNVLEIVDVGGSPSLPAIDASQVTGLDYTNLTNVPTSFISSLQYITDQNPLTLTAGVHYIMANATDTLKVLTVPDSANGGDIIRITNWGLGRLKLTTGGSNTTFLLSGLDVVGGETAGEVFVESKCTVDLVGFDYAPADLLPAWGVYFISSIEINTKGLTTSGQAIVYNATTGKLEGGDAGDFASAYTPTNYTIADAKFDSHFAGIDTALGLKAATADVLLSANDLSDLADVATARTNLGLGTAALVDTGTGAGDVVVLEDVGGTVKLPALDGSQLTNLPATSAALDDLTDVVITSPVNGQALVYNNATSQWVNGSTTGDLIDVTSASPSGTYTITSQAGVQEVYLLTLGANTTVTIPSASGPGAGYVYVIKNMSSFTMTITPSSGTIDGSASFASSVQYAAISLVSDGTNWFII